MIALIRVVKMVFCVLAVALGLHLIDTGKEWTTPKIRTVVLTDVYEYVDADNQIKARGKFKDVALKTTFQYPITHKLYTEFQSEGYKDAEMTVTLTRKEVGDPSYPRVQVEVIPNVLFVVGGFIFIWNGVMLIRYRNQPRRRLSDILPFDDSQR